MKLIRIAILGLLIAAFVYLIVAFYNYQRTLQLSVDYLQEQIMALYEKVAQVSVPCDRKPAEPLRPSIWSDIQSKIKNTVVQVFSQGAQFNWLEPYKTPQQFQVTGSGFFINYQNKILIITNAHVVNEAYAVSIQLPCGGKRRYEVDIVGVSPERDLAALMLKSEEQESLIRELGTIPFLTFGDSDSVHRADEIMALGYPLGQQSLKSTTGVVSGREHLDGHSMIQISAPINPGSSGGPSLDTLGRVVGVNTAGITQAQNVGYFIPSNEVQLFLRQLDRLPETGSIKFLRKPFLGVIFNNATEQLTAYLGNPIPGGLYVVEVYKGSPLHKAGIESGDMIYEIDGHKIDLFGEMSVPWSEDRISIIDYIARLTIGDTINLQVYRHGKPRKFTFKFNAAELAPVRIIYPAYEKIDYEVIGGLVVMPLAINHLPLLLQGAPELSRFMDLKNQLEPALVVAHVFPDSVAARTRTVGPGAVIKEINGERVKNLAEFREALKKSEKSNYLTLKTVENVFTVMNWNQIVQQEKKMSTQYFYQISPFIKELIEQHNSPK